jgi:hypothetical protein
VREIIQGFFLTKFWDQCVTVLNMVVNLQIPQKAMNLMTSRAAATQADLSGTEWSRKLC